MKIFGIFAASSRAMQATFFVLAVAALFLPVTQRVIVNGYENASYYFAPSAGKAYEYGTNHFNSRRARDYDITRAENFLREAARLSPDHQTVFHQLARVAFLRGRMNEAMVNINIQIEKHGTSTPSSYYVRGLIEGFMGRYDAATADYKQYLQHEPNNWAALNDYAWVLLKAGKHEEALDASTRGLKYFPANPWLLNSKAIALYELGRYEEAMETIHLADAASSELTEEMWLTAYPGNDPQIAKEGIKNLQKAARDNMHKIELALNAHAVQ